MTLRTLGHFWFRLLATLLACAAPFEPILLSADQVTVRHMEGLMHGFMALRTLDGKRLADGEMTQVAEGDRVTSRLIFRFKDGSVYDDTTIFSQRGAFRVLSDHLVQRGPSFKQPMETSIDAASGQIMVRYKDQDGKEKVLKERRDLPPDVANGLLFTLVKHIQPDVPQTTVSMVATTPKPRVVKLEILPEGKKAIASGNTKHETVRYVVKVKIGGVAGFVARLSWENSLQTRTCGFLLAMLPLSSNWKVRFMSAVPSGELNWQLRQDSNRLKCTDEDLRRIPQKTSCPEVFWVQNGFRSSE